jgi:Arc/MetJ-type ribon-helix-helix transcriptional regulator
VTQQIAVRLPDDIVEFIDQQIADGRASSRADAVKRAVQREKRRILAERDAAIYAAIRNDADPELEAWVDHAAQVHLDID